MKAREAAICEGARRSGFARNDPEYCIVNGVKTRFSKDLGRSQLHTYGSIISTS